jgi:hypothetical protein
MRAMVRLLIPVALACLVARPAAAAPCVPSTLAAHIAGGASGCELSRSDGSPASAAIHDLQFELERSIGLAFSAASVVLVPGAWPGRGDGLDAWHAGGPSWWFDAPELGEGDEAAYRITYTVDFLRGSRGHLRVTGGPGLWPAFGVRTRVCLGAAFDGEVCAGEEWVVGERGAGRSFPPVTVVGIRHDVRLTEGMSGFTEVAAGRDVPEPTSVVLLAAGLAGAWWRRRRIGLGPRQSTATRRTRPSPGAQWYPHSEM